MENNEKYARNRGFGPLRVRYPVSYYGNNIDS